MANLKPYGHILVWAGMATGTFIYLWDGGTNKRRYAESVAELAASAEDLEHVPYIVGDTFTWPTNRTISARVLWKDLYSFTTPDIMVDAREWLTNSVRDSVGDLPHNPVNMHWLSADITTGEPMAEAVVVWTNTVDNTWVCSTPAKVTDHTLCTSSIVDDNNSRLMPHTPEFNLPLMDELYPDIDTVQTNGIFGGTNNWWRANGMGTNVYKYACEYWENLDGTYVDITQISGTGFTLVTNRIFTGFGGAFDIETISVNTNLEIMTAQLWEVSLDREGAEAYTARFAVGDSVNHQGPTNIVLSSYSLTVSEGSTTSFNLNPKWDTGTTDIISWSVPGGGVTALYAGFSTFFQWNGAGQAWNIPISIVVTAPEDDDSEDNAAIIQFVKQAEPAIFTYIPVWIVDDDTDPVDVSLFPVVDEVEKEETNTVQGALSDEAQDIFLQQNKRLLTTNLLQAATVLRAFTRSVYVLEPSEMTYSNRVTYFYEDSSQLYTNVSSGAPSSVYEYYTILDALDEYNNTLEPASPDSITTNTATLYEIARPSITLSERNFESVVGGNNASFSDVRADTSSRMTKYNNCSVLWPSYFAITNGNVAKIRIYGLFKTTAPDVQTISLIDEANTTVEIFEPDSSKPQFYNDKTYDAVSSVMQIPIDSGNIPVQQVWVDDTVPIFGTPEYAEMVPALLFEDTTPTTLPVFSIGSNDNTGTLTTNDFQYAKSQILDLVAAVPITRDKQVDMLSLCTISLYKILVVIDWDWDHLE